MFGKVTVFSLSKMVILPKVKRSIQKKKDSSHSIQQNISNFKTISFSFLENIILKDQKI